MIPSNTRRDLTKIITSEIEDSMTLSDREKIIVYWAVRYATDRIKAKLEIDMET